MKKIFSLPALLLVLFVLVALYAVRVLWKSNLKFLSVIAFIVACIAAYIAYPLIQPLFW